MTMPLPEKVTVSRETRASFVSMIMLLITIATTTLIYFVYRDSVQLGEIETSNLLADQQLLAERMASNLAATLNFGTTDFSALEANRLEYDRLLNKIRQQTIDGHVADASASQQALAQVTNVWPPLNEKLTRISGLSASVVEVGKLLNHVDGVMPAMVKAVEEVEQLAQTRTVSPEIIALINHQSFLVQRMAGSIDRLLDNRNKAYAERMSSYNQIAHDSVVFEGAMSSLIGEGAGGARGMVTDRVLKEKLHSLAFLYEDLNAVIAIMLDKESELAGFYSLVAGAEKDIQAFIHSTAGLAGIDAIDGFNATGYLLFGLLLTGLLILGVKAVVVRGEYAQPVRLKIIDEDKKDRPNILYVDERGDGLKKTVLRGQPLSEQYMPHVSRINDALEPFRSQVMLINDAALRVAGIAKNARREVVQLVNSCDLLAQQVVESSNTSENVGSLIRRVESNARTAGDLIKEMNASLQLGAEPGDRRMQDSEIDSNTSKQVIADISALAMAMKKIGETSGKIKEYAGKIDLAMINATIDSSAGGKESRIAEAAVEVQDVTAKVENTARALESMLASVGADLEKISAKLWRRSSAISDSGGSDYHGEKMHLVELSGKSAKRVANINNSIGKQVELNNHLMLSLGEVQTSVVQLSAGASDIMESIDKIVVFSDEIGSAVERFGPEKSPAETKDLVP